jgi:hypothetical protein
VSAKIDFKKTLGCYRAKRDIPQIIDVPDMQYLMIDGHGDPNSPGFEIAIRSLYPLAYKLKFASKQQLERDYVVPPLEALWWADDMEVFTTARDKSLWSWTAMIMTPEWITPTMFDETRSSLTTKTPSERIADVRLETLSEKTSVQALHVGSYDDEAPLLEKMHHDFIPNHGLQMTMQHHEIYLSDFRRTPAEKLRTILRQPVSA